jgi:hypothetical protein
MPIDYKRYPTNWKTEIVPEILNRAAHKCEICNLENGSFVWGIKLWVKNNGKYKIRSIWFRDRKDAERENTHGVVRKIKVVLTIAHLDHDETNHDVILERLKAMCQCCHLRYDANEKYRRQQEKWKQTKQEEER